MEYVTRAGGKGKEKLPQNLHFQAPRRPNTRKKSQHFIISGA